MKYRNPKKDSDLFSMMDHQREITQTVRGINKLNDVIDWELFRPELESFLGYDNRDLSKGGRSPFDPVFMLKVLALQEYYDLSDEQTEFQIGHRFSFMQFLGLQPGDSVPDEKTIWDFKGLLDKDGGGSARKLFECFTSQLSSEGMIACAGSIVDASFVDAPRQRNSREQNAQIKAGERPEGLEAETAKGRQKDYDAPWTMKNTETHYGYKNHTKVDAKSKVVLSYKSTAASVHDPQVLEDLIDDEDQAMFAYSAYTSKYSDERLLKNDCQNCIQFKARRGHPLTAEEITTNKLRSRIRVRCEHIFGRMSQMALDRIRSTA